MGYFVRFIHNRDLAVENIMKALVRKAVVLNSPPSYVKRLLRRLEKRGFALPKHSILNMVHVYTPTVLSLSL
jgi:hypothetical protein